MSSADSPSPDIPSTARAARTALAAAQPAVVRIGRAPGRGCGIVVAAGRVLTNAHNLRDRTTEVAFADGRTEQGRIAGVDPDGDLVVLEVDTGDTPAVAWAGEAAEPGEVVFAVGRSADGGARITYGMVSGAERSFRGPRGRRITGSLEHTAPLARGSSGSPLVDASGRLLGINTARLADGFYLAIPADPDLRARVDALVRGESIHRLVLGVGLAPADVARQLRASVGLADREGLLVRSVSPDSPAERAGVKTGDLITKADGHDVATVDDLHTALDVARGGRHLALHVVRGADELDLTVDFDETTTDADPEA
ncbi:MAG: trypsin-like peptidase domain-containing protein [Acidimicrobiales bacterium]